MKLVQIIREVFIVTLVTAGSLSGYGANIDDVDIMATLIRQPMEQLPIELYKEEGTLLFSDSPEYAKGSGILYSDQVTGKNRMFFYHVNERAIDQKIVVMAYNPKPTDVMVLLSNMAYGDPSERYFKVGKTVSRNYFTGSPNRSVTVPAYGYAMLDDGLNKIAIKPHELMSGSVDIELPSKMFVSSVIMPYNADPYLFMMGVNVMKSDASHLRGTYHGMNRWMTAMKSYDTAGGIGYIRLADGDSDSFLIGMDALEQRKTSDRGNYGVDYTVEVATVGTGNINLYLNTEGGAYAGVMEITAAGKTTLASVPRQNGTDFGSDYIGDQNAYGMEYLATVPAGRLVTLHFSPPGASNLPVRIIMASDKAIQAVAKIVKDNEANLAIQTAMTEKTIATINSTANTAKNDTLGIHDRIAKILR